MRSQSDQQIRHALIIKTPPGSSPDHVLMYLKSQNYCNFGGYQPEYVGRSAFARDPNVRGGKIAIGKKSIGPVLLEHYRVNYNGEIMEMCILAVWPFDENDKLIDIIVTKEIDSI